MSPPSSTELSIREAIFFFFPGNKMDYIYFFPPGILPPVGKLGNSYLALQMATETSPDLGNIL